MVGCHKAGAIYTIIVHTTQSFINQSVATHDKEWQQSTPKRNAPQGYSMHPLVTYMVLHSFAYLSIRELVCTYYFYV